MSIKNKMSSLSLMALVMLLITACTSEPEQTNDKDINRDEITITDTILPDNFYKRLEGTIAGQPVVMHLHRAGGKVDGIYYYTDQGKWISLNYVQDSSTKNGLHMREHDVTAIYSGTEDIQDPVVILHYENGRFKGIWENGAKSHSIELKEVYPKGSYPFNMQFYADSIAAFPDKANAPIARVSTFFPVATKEPASWLNRKLQQLLDFDTTITDMAAAAKSKSKKYLEAYRSDVQEMGPYEDVPAFLNYEELQNVAIRFNEKDYLIAESLFFSYEGGAHGNYGVTMRCYDIHKQKELRLPDILIIDSATLVPILERNFRLQASLKPGEALTKVLFEKHLSLTNNFYFTNKGIGFAYNPYEIAAYAQGIIHVFVPFTELKPYLNPEFVERMQL